MKSPSPLLIFCSSDLVGAFLCSTHLIFPHQGRLSIYSSPEILSPHPSSVQVTSPARAIDDKLRHSFRIDQSVLDLTMTIMKWTRAIISIRRNALEMEHNPAFVQARPQILEAFNDVHKTQHADEQYQKESHLSPAVSVALESACKAATSICWKLIQPRTPEVEQIQFEELLELKIALEETETSDWHGGLEVLLWILLVAIAADKHGPDRRWFKARLLALLFPLGMSQPLTTAHLIQDFV